MEQCWIIRNENKEDYRAVEELTRKAFWNVNVPGCNEHYLAHVIRGHEDFIPELDLVIEFNGRIIGNIMYTEAYLTDETGNEKKILTFGPISILPEYQRQGYGKALLEDSFTKAAELGYDAIVIFGNPANYVSSGFKSCKKYNVSLGEDFFPLAMLVKELTPGVLQDRNWIYHESPAYQIDESAAQEFDLQFEPMEKGHRTSHEAFYIYSHSRVEG